MNWKEYKLGDIAIIKGGKRLPKGINLIATPNVHPYIRVRDLGSKKCIELDSSYEYVDDDTQKLISNYIVNTDDIIISIVGTIGLVAIIGKTLNKANLTENCVKIINLKYLDKDFLYYYLISDYGKQEINKGIVGAVQAKLPIKNIQAITIKAPEIIYQKRIASILKSLDDKIENNRKINENLEQQAQALFKSWFVDFEPFRDQPFVESELGMIPEGWRVGTLGEIATISKKSINPANEPDKLYSHYSLPAFDDNQYPQKQFGKDIKSNKFLFNEDSILLSKLNPTIKRVWYVDKLDDNPICSTEFLPIETINNAFIAFVYCCIKDELYYSKLLSGVTGATNSHQRLSPNDIVNLRIPINEKSIEDFNLIVLPMLTMINANIRDNLHLSHLRDTLLPKLMSGELKIS